MAIKSDGHLRRRRLLTSCAVLQGVLGLTLYMVVPGVSSDPQVMNVVFPGTVLYFGWLIINPNTCSAPLFRYAGMTAIVSSAMLVLVNLMCVAELLFRVWISRLPYAQRQAPELWEHFGITLGLLLSTAMLVLSTKVYRGELGVRMGQDDGVTPEAASGPLPIEGPSE